LERFLPFLGGISVFFFGVIVKFLTHLAEAFFFLPLSLSLSLSFSLLSFLCLYAVQQKRSLGWLPAVWLLVFCLAVEEGRNFFNLERQFIKRQQTRIFYPNRKQL
jgi:hypothetical protein